MKVYTHKEFVKAIESAVLEHFLTEGYGIRPCDIAEVLEVTTQKVGRYLGEASIVPVSIIITRPARDYPTDAMLAREVEVTSYEPTKAHMMFVINKLRREGAAWPLPPSRS